MQPRGTEGSFWGPHSLTLEGAVSSSKLPTTCRISPQLKSQARGLRKQEGTVPVVSLWVLYPCVLPQWGRVAEAGVGVSQGTEPSPGPVETENFF